MKRLRVIALSTLILFLTLTSAHALSGLDLTGSLTVDGWTSGFGQVYIAVTDGSDFATSTVLGMTSYDPVNPATLPPTYSVEDINSTAGQSVYVHGFWDANNNVVDPFNPVPDGEDQVGTAGPFTLADGVTSGADLVIGGGGGGPTGSISGSITCPAYDGQHSVFVAAYDSPDPLTASRVGNGGYEITNLAADNSYFLDGIPSDPGTPAYVFAFWDANGNADPGDPQPDVGDYIGAPFLNPQFVGPQQPDLSYVDFELLVQRETGFTISGALTSATQTIDGSGGALYIMVFDGPDYSTANVLAMMHLWPDPFPTTYSFTSLAGNPGDTVYVFAYWDANGDWQPGPGPGDIIGEYNAGSGLVLAGTHSNIDVPLETVMPGATLQGTVTSDGGSRNIGGIGVSVYTEKYNWNSNVGGTLTNPDGTYTIPDLPPGEVFVQFSPEWSHKNFMGGFYTGGGPVNNDFNAAVSIGLNSGATTTINADLESGPNPFYWFEPGVYTYSVEPGVFNSTLEFDFGIQPAFRDMVVSATVQTPNRGFHTYDLAADRFNTWDTPCRFLDMWTKPLGDSVAAEDYGVYTLTVTFDGGFQEVRTYNFDPPDNQPIGVVDGSIAVTVNADGSVDVNWNQDQAALGLGQRYQVRVREVDTNKEVFRSSSQSADPGQAMSRTLSAGELQCLELGRDYKWLVRAFSEDGHHSVTKLLAPLAYAPTSLDVRTTDAQVYAWKGGLLFNLPVRYGSLNEVTAASVTRPDAGGVYNFDLTFDGSDWYDGSTETRLYLRSWSHWESGPVAGGTYNFSVTYSDSHVENFTRTLPDPIPQFPPVNIATMGAQVHPDGAITFKWDVPQGGEGNMFQVRVRDQNGKEYFKSQPQGPGENQATGWFWDLRSMVPGQYYKWFVRQWDPTFQVMMESQRFDFLYDPWGLSDQRPPESDGYALASDEFLYVANEGDMGPGTEIVQIASDGSARIVGTGFHGPSGLAIQPGTGNLFISDDRNGIYSVQPDGTITQVLTGIVFSNPNGLAFDASGRLLVAEAGDRISRVNPADANSYEVLAHGFSIPQAVGAVGDDVYFTDANGYVYQILGSDTNLPKDPGTVTNYTANRDVMGTQGGLVIDPGGNVIATDSNGKIISIFAGDGSVSTVLDMPGRQFRGLAYSPSTNTLLATVFNDHEVYEIPLGVWPPEPQVFSGASQNKLFGPFGAVVSTTDFGPFMSPLYADTDNDGVADPEDAFPNDPAASVDSDLDGKPDDWHPGMNEANSTSVPPLVLDDNDDNDAVLDNVPDNCRTIPNDDQADWNGDGIGDACDPNIWQIGLSGQVTSSVWASGQGNIYIFAFDRSDYHNAQVWGMGQFSDAVPFNHTTYLWNGGPGNQVWGFAFWDANGNADPNNPTPDAGDFVGEFSNNPITLANPGLPGVNIAIEEPFNPAAAAFIEGNLMNVNTADGIQTFFMADIYNYSGTLPDDIQALTITGPGGVNMTWDASEIAAQKDGLEFYPDWNELFVSVPGSPQVGEYVFTVTINGTPLVYKDFQHINRTLPIPTGATMNVTSKTPMFTWDDITGIPGATVAFRFQVKDSNGNYVISTPRTNGMTSYTIPAGKLNAGGNYSYRVRASDSEQWLDVQNRAHTSWVPFTMSGTPDHAAVPTINPDEWNAVIWNNGSAMCWVEINDADGVASDGSSHQVSVTPPGGSAVPLVFEGSRDATSANYSVFLGGQPQSGDYVIDVTDPNGLTDTLTDNVVVAGMVPPDETQLRPSLRNPYVASLSATFDNVVAEGPGTVTLNEDFSSYPDNSSPDPARFMWWGNGEINVSGQALQLSSLPVVGRGDVTVSLKDAGAYNSLQADVTVTAASSGGAPRARLSGAWFNLDGSDVYTSVSVKKNVVVFSVSQDIRDETYHWNTLASGILKSTSIGETITLKIDWTGTALILSADEASYTYTPSGVILPARYPDRNLQVRLNLFASVTPKFAWNQIAGANRYRVRIYDYTGNQTLHKGYVDDGAVTSYVVPPGVLRPNGYYQYRIEAWDVAGATVDNFSKTNKFRFYTGAPGDVNTDGFVDLADAVNAFQISSGQPAYSWAARIGDANADGKIDTADAAFILQNVGGLRNNP